MGVASLTVLGMASVLVTVTLNLTAGWTIDAICPGSKTFCDGVFWQAAVDYLPAWLFIAQVMVVIALASPVAIFRVDR